MFSPGRTSIRESNVVLPDRGLHLIDVARECAKHALGELAPVIAPIDGCGSRNHVFSVILPDGKRYVLRIRGPFAPQDTPPPFEKQVIAIQLAQRFGIPIAPFAGRGIGVISRFGEGNYWYTCNEMLSGVVLFRVTEPRVRWSVWCEAGRFMRRLHDIKVDGLGDVFAPGIAGKRLPSWPAYVESLFGSNGDIGRIERVLRERCLIEKDLLNQALQRIQDLRTKPWENLPLVLHHGDLHNANILVCPDSGKITGIIDWEFTAGFIPVYLDFARVTRWLINQLPVSIGWFDNDDFSAFIDGYGITRKRYDEYFKRDIETLQVVDTLSFLAESITRQGLPEYLRVGSLKKLCEILKRDD